MLCRLLLFLSLGAVLVEVNCILGTLDGCRTLENNACNFPFTHKNRTYHSCTFDYSGYFTGFQPWCKTSTNETGKDPIEICSDECPIPPRFCGEPKIKNLFDRENEQKTFEPLIEQQPWMVSLGNISGSVTWNHECAGSLISGKHVLTAALCFARFNYNKNLLDGFRMRLGVADFSSSTIHDGIFRFVNDILIHPEASLGVAIAVADRIIEFNSQIAPICLPFQPVDEEDQFESKLFVVAGWGNDKNVPLTSPPRLLLNNLKVFSKDECKKKLMSSVLESSGLPPNIINQIPGVLQTEQTCIEGPTLAEQLCIGYPGSPGIVSVDNTARNHHYIQHFMLTSGFDCQLPVMLYVQISSRKVLTWIQKMTGF